MKLRLPRIVVRASGQSLKARSFRKFNRGTQWARNKLERPSGAPPFLDDFNEFIEDGIGFRVSFEGPNSPRLRHVAPVSQSPSLLAKHPRGVLVLIRQPRQAGESA